MWQEALSEERDMIWRAETAQVPSNMSGSTRLDSIKPHAGVNTLNDSLHMHLSPAYNQSKLIKNIGPRFQLPTS